MSFTTLFLVRHGQTDWNLAGKIQGHTDIPLNETGKTQAQKVAQHLKKKQASIAALYSSDLQRAHQTAREIANGFALEIILNADLREGYFGKLEGLTKQEQQDLYGHSDLELLCEEVNAEPRNKVVVRALNCLHGIVQKHTEKHIVVVTWMVASFIACSPGVRS